MPQQIEPAKFQSRAMQVNTSGEAIIKSSVKTKSTARNTMIDALRGGALLAIMLLHNVEHFSYYAAIADQPSWLTSLDAILWKGVVLLFGSKAYGIFALLFGFSFYLQQSKQERPGELFGRKYLMRLLMLLCIGIGNSVFYKGDILVYYAVFGFLIIPFSNWTNKAILVVAGLLLLQPLQVFEAIASFTITHYSSVTGISESYLVKSLEISSTRSFFNMAQLNMTTGRVGVLLWSFETGRLFQIPALFLLGIYFGRRGGFVNNYANRKLWSKILLISLAVSIPLIIIKAQLPVMIKSIEQNVPVKALITSWSNISFMFVLLAAFILLFYGAGKALGKLSILGKMSLTNYVMQSIIGTFVYYTYGLNLQEVAGATVSLIIGLGLFALQAGFCTWWLKNYKQGPLESFVRKAVSYLSPAN